MSECVLAYFGMCCADKHQGFHMPADTHALRIYHDSVSPGAEDKREGGVIDPALCLWVVMSPRLDCS